MRAMDPTRFDVRLCSLSAATTSWDGVQVQSLNCDSVLDVRTLARLRRVLRDWPPDVVHTHLVRGDWYGRTAAASLGVPVICSTVHNEDDRAYDSDFGRIVRIVAEAINRITAPSADSIVAISEGVREYVVERQKQPREKVVVIPNGIDTEHFRPARSNDLRSLCGFGADTIVVGALGRLAEQKGLPSLIEAAVIARRARPELRFVVAGSGRQEAELRQLIADRGQSDAFFLIGQRSDVPSFLAGLDIFVMPSLWEGMGLALLEAMAVGVACIATDIGGPREAITNRIDGLLVPPGDPERLASAIEELAASESLRRAYGAAARETVLSRFSSSAMAEQYMRLYETLLP
jgi:glycosyltransferase involved in cell wall biosynthesis